MVRNGLLIRKEEGDFLFLCFFSLFLYPLPFLFSIILKEEKAGTEFPMLRLQRQRKKKKKYNK